MKREDVLARLLPLNTHLRFDYNISTMFLYGSVANNKARPGSDVHLLVEFNKPVGLFEYIDLKQHLESILGCKVDLGTLRSLKRSKKVKVLSEAVCVA
jgi:uncharacterized protein